MRYLATAQNTKSYLKQNPSGGYSLKTYVNEGDFTWQTYIKKRGNLAVFHITLSLFFLFLPPL
jgi:hypothetical protein